MARDTNIFHNLVTDENSTTELLCNLMRFSAFRSLLLTRFLSEACASNISFDDIETQPYLADQVRPDLIISNDRVCVFIEIKVTQFREVTSTQPNGYFECLMSKYRGQEQWLVFLVPQNWVHLQFLSKSLDGLNRAHPDCNVQTRVVFWEHVLDLLENNDLRMSNQFVNEFYELLEARIRPRKIVFSTREVLMLFSREFPKALSNLEQFIGELQAKSSAYKSRPSGSKGLRPDYGLNFLNTQNEPILWFGVWSAFWEKEGAPLCFGVRDKWGPAIRQAFCAHYDGTKSFQNWTLGSVSQEILGSDNGVVQVWGQLAPILEAVMRASVETRPHVA